MRRLFVFTVVIMLLTSVLTDAKKKNAKKDKGEKVKREVDEEKDKKEKEKNFVEKPTKVEKEKTEDEEIPDKGKRSKHQQCSQMSEEHLSAYRAPSPVEQQQQHQYHRPHIAKPKSIKVLTAYEQCKLECKKKRDQADTEEYVQRLKDELAQAEAALAERKAIEEQAMREQQQQFEATNKEPILEIKVNKPEMATSV